MMLVFGNGERAVRALTVIFGIGTLATSWWIGRRWLTPLGAAVLVALCGTGEWLVFFTLVLKDYLAVAAGAPLVTASAGWTMDERDGRASPARRFVVWLTVAGASMW